VDLEAILNKVLSRFYILDNLKVAVQFISDAIIAVYEAEEHLNPSLLVEQRVFEAQIEDEKVDGPNS